MSKDVTFTIGEVARFADLAECRIPGTAKGEAFLTRVAVLAVDGDPFTVSDRAQDIADQVVGEFREDLLSIYMDLQPRPDLDYLKGESLLAGEIAGHALFATATTLANELIDKED